MIAKIARRGGIVLAVLISVRIAAGCLFPTLNINDVTTGVTAAYPDLQPQTFGRSYEQVFDATAAVGRELGWEVTQEDRGTGVIQAIATTPLVHFKDDVTITITRAGERTQVSIRSHSRVGKGDLGTNAKRIRLFQAALATRLSGG
jgi:uncharacterized protein (DUF1499 family)